MNSLNAESRAKRPVVGHLSTPLQISSIHWQMGLTVAPCQFCQALHRDRQRGNSTGTVIAIGAACSKYRVMVNSSPTLRVLVKPIIMM